MYYSVINIKVQLTLYFLMHKNIVYSLFTLTNCGGIQTPNYRKSIK